MEEDNLGQKRYFCARCKYRFKYNTLNEQLALKCPYCGQQDKLMEDKMDAASILDDSSSDKYD